MIVYLIGYMGCGKSSIGVKLAKKLNYKFVDLDDLIEEKEERSISQIFETEGESGFRGLERKYLKSTFELKNTVVSTGGGTPCFYDNMVQMNQKGLSIYLYMDVSSLAFRLTNAKKKRPLIEGLMESELKEFIAQQLSEREIYYESAKMIISSFGFNAKKMEELEELIYSFKD